MWDGKKAAVTQVYVTYAWYHRESNEKSEKLGRQGRRNSDDKF